MCIRHPGGFLGLKAGWSMVQTWGSESSVPGAAAAPLCTKPGLPSKLARDHFQHHGWGQVGLQESTIFWLLSDCVDSFLGGHYIPPSPALSYPLFP